MHPLHLSAYCWSKQLLACHGDGKPLPPPSFGAAALAEEAATSFL